MVVRTRESLGMSWIRTGCSCPLGDHSSKLQISPDQSATLRDPAILFLVPHGSHITLQEALDNVFAGGSSVDFSYPGAGICPLCGIIPIPSDFCSWNFLPWTSLNAPDRLFLS